MTDPQVERELEGAWRRVHDRFKVEPVQWALYLTNEELRALGPDARAGLEQLGLTIVLVTDRQPLVRRRTNDLSMRILATVVVGALVGALLLLATLT